MAHATISALHFTYLGGLLPSRIFELGPAPVDVPDEYADTIIEQLSTAGFLTDPATLSPEGRELLTPLVDFSEAYHGLFLLHNMQQPVTFDMQDEWAGYLKDSFSDVPRAYFLIARKGQTVTTAVRAGDDITITSTTPADAFSVTAAEQILAIGDPDKTWKPMPIAPIGLPQTLLAKAPPRRPAADSSTPQLDAAYARRSSAFTGALRAAGIAPSAVADLQKLLTYDHIAAAHCVYSHGPRKSLSEGAVTVDYFHQKGVTVSSLRQATGGAVWKMIYPAQARFVAEALADLTRLPSSPIQHGR